MVEFTAEVRSDFAHVGSQLKSWSDLCLEPEQLDCRHPGIYLDRHRAESIVGFQFPSLESRRKPVCWNIFKARQLELGILQQGVRLLVPGDTVTAICHIVQYGYVRILYIAQTVLGKAIFTAFHIWQPRGEEFFSAWRLAAVSDVGNSYHNCISY